ncbi:dUTP diphosphatase [Bacillus sp. FSL L8-0199]|uniref:dUTP diphosphatase n=1 Tax=Bacillus sp. FSL L8-0199 TaxID=2954616 RepID=UPI0030FC4BC2|nr:dUTP diphosphatase [Bacillus cereus]
MDIKKLFAMQNVLDKRVLESKNLSRKEVFEFRILAFLDELGECMKEWRVFKFWSNDRKPRTSIPTGKIKVLDDGCKVEVYKNPLLEEYVDGLHFAIGLCIDLKTEINFPASMRCETVTEHFFELYQLAIRLKEEPTAFRADVLLAHYLGLGELLGFSLEEIEFEYIEKNKVNHERQSNGY